jgi:DNA helicase HerA-like ATPase
VLERLLAETSLRVIVLDPNFDYVKLSHVRPDAPADEASRYRPVIEGIEVLQAGPTDEHPLRVRFGELEAACQAALLHLDPVEDGEEYSALLGVLDHDARGQPLIDDLASLEGDGALQLGRRAANLGLDKLDIWESGRGGSIVDRVADDDWRCLVVDLGSVGSRDGQAVVTNAVLSTLWKLRARRQPVLVVIDEAHNVCPALPVGRLSELATEQTIQIAAEGRKFGLHLLISTQRPQKVHENVISQCDNLVLMRMNSAADVAHLGTVFSFVPAGLLVQSTGFGLGEALIAGGIAPQPALIRFGQRITEEGGSDVSKDWANRA